MRYLAISLALILCVACSAREEKYDGDAPAADAAAASSDALAAPPGKPPSLTKPNIDGSTSPRIAAGPPMLAYEYTYRLSLPPSRVDQLRRNHETACIKAGYRVCQVVGTNIVEVGKDQIEGDLVLRAAPAWLQRLRDGLSVEANQAGGKLISSSVASEDLSREIVDTAAQLKAKTTLRDRLQVLLASRPGKVADLLEVERELARVQGEIDSTQSQLAVMEGRVATSLVTLNYQSMDVFASASAWEPLSKSFSEFLTILALSLAGMVQMLAWLAPWVLVGGGLLWTVRKRLPKLNRVFPRKPSISP